MRVKGRHISTIWFNGIQIQIRNKVRHILYNFEAVFFQINGWFKHERYDVFLLLFFSIPDWNIYWNKCLYLSQANKGRCANICIYFTPRAWDPIAQLTTPMNYMKIPWCDINLPRLTLRNIIFVWANELNSWKKFQFVDFYAKI